MKNFIVLLIVLTCFDNVNAQKPLTIGEITKKVLELEANNSKSNTSKSIYSDKAKNEVLYIGTGKYNTGFLGIPFKLNIYEEFKEGTVISISSNGNDLTVSQKEMDNNVVGVLGEPVKDGEDKHDYYVALIGKAKIRVVVPDSTMKISVGDLLVTSNIKGVAIKAIYSNCEIVGKVIGKAMENYDNLYSEGLIEILLRN